MISPQNSTLAPTLRFETLIRYVKIVHHPKGIITGNTPLRRSQIFVVWPNFYIWRIVLCLLPVLTHLRSNLWKDHHSCRSKRLTWSTCRFLFSCSNLRYDTTWHADGKFDFVTVWLAWPSRHRRRIESSASSLFVTFIPIWRQQFKQLQLQWDALFPRVA